MHSSDNPYVSNGPAPANPNEAKNARGFLCEDIGDYVSTLPKYEGNPLENIYKRMKSYDKGMCDSWKDEVDNLLIFAGLFSAIVTAFTIESYKWLKEDSMATSAQLLAQLSLQLSAIASQNATAALVVPVSSFTPDPSSVRINILWFISLITSLSAVFFGILCSQWLREFTRERLVPPDEAIPIRQLCYEGLMTWKVPQILASLPVLLQVSVLLFSVGILDLLWTLHRAVAISITTLVAMVALVVVCTAMAPLAQIVLQKKPDAICPYKSPLSRIFLKLSRFSKSSWFDVDFKIHTDHEVKLEGGKKYNITGFTQALEWMKKSLRPSQNPEVARDLYYAFRKEFPMAVSKLVATLDQKEESRLHDYFMLELLEPIKLSAANCDLEHRFRILKASGDTDATALGPIVKEIAESIECDFALHSEILSFTLDRVLDNKNGCSWQDHICPHLGQALDGFFHRTQITEHNFSECKGILRKLNTLLEHLHEDTSSTYLKDSMRDIPHDALEKWEENLKQMPQGAAQAVSQFTEHVRFFKDLIKKPFYYPEKRNRTLRAVPGVMQARRKD